MEMSTMVCFPSCWQNYPEAKYLEFHWNVTSHSWFSVPNIHELSMSQWHSNVFHENITWHQASAQQELPTTSHHWSNIVPILHFYLSISGSDIECRFRSKGQAGRQTLFISAIALDMFQVDDEYDDNTRMWIDDDGIVLGWSASGRGRHHGGRESIFSWPQDTNNTRSRSRRSKQNISILANGLCRV